MMAGELFVYVCVPFKKSFSSKLVSLLGFVMCRVSMIGVHGVV